MSPPVQAAVKVLITGAGGQLGRELQATAPGRMVVAAYDSAGLDVTDRARVRDVLERERPAVVINAAAYTAVDAAEGEPERAEAVNAGGAAHVAEAACRVGARMIQVSTDFVFDGARGEPYTPDDAPSPTGVYGATKLAGERAVLRLCAGNALVVRTAWLYSAHGHNFVQTMLRRFRGAEEVGVVSDQVGSPTWSRSLAGALWAAAGRPDVQGIHHWTDAGLASRFDFAVAVQDEALAIGLLDHAVAVRPVRSAEFPTPARRPSYCVLDSSATAAALGLPPSYWRHNLRAMLQGLARA
jgi:dTDP-4-dehydrorhamnose reductase